MGTGCNENKPQDLRLACNCIYDLVLTQRDGIHKTPWKAQCLLPEKSCWNVSHLLCSGQRELISLKGNQVAFNCISAWSPPSWLRAGHAGVRKSGFLVHPPSHSDLAPVPCGSCMVLFKPGNLFSPVIPHIVSVPLTCALERCAISLSAFPTAPCCLRAPRTPCRTSYSPVCSARALLYVQRSWSQGCPSAMPPAQPAKQLLAQRSDRSCRWAENGKCYFFPCIQWKEAL